MPRISSTVMRLVVELLLVSIGCGADSTDITVPQDTHYFRVEVKPENGGSVEALQQQDNTHR